MEVINKLSLLHLVGCLYFCINDARSHKHQIQVNNVRGPGAVAQGPLPGVADSCCSSTNLQIVSHQQLCSNVQQYSADLTLLFVLGLCKDRSAVPYAFVGISGQ